MADITDFRFYLLRELDKRQSKNAAYSLTAFARDLGMSTQKLSQILKRISGISPRAARDIANHLNLKPEERELFFALVDANHSRSGVIRKRAQEKVDSIRKRVETFEFNDETFLPLGKWSHWAAYLLVEVEDFRPDLDWICQRLGLDSETCQQTYSDLFKSGFLILGESGEWLQSHRQLQFSPKTSTQEIRDFYRGVLTKGQEALDREPIDQRYFRVAMVPLPDEAIAEISKRITDFAFSILNDYATTTKTPTRVYSLTMGLHPLDRKKS